MASITAHLTIAYRALPRLPLERPAQFLLGAIAPDSVPSAEKGFTHYIERVDGKPYYRWETFLDEYWEYGEGGDRDYILGYLCHLLADGVWDACVRFPLREVAEFVALGPDRLPTYYEEISRLDMLIRPARPAREDIAAQLRQAVFPGIPRGLDAERVQACTAWSCQDLFKEHDEVSTRFIQPDQVARMCDLAVKRTVEVTADLLAAGHPAASLPKKRGT